MAGTTLNTEDDACSMCGSSMMTHYQIPVIRFPMPLFEESVFVKDDEDILQSPLDVMECQGFMTNHGHVLSRRDLHDTLRLRGYIT
jgi:hypothetical protein